MRSLTLFALSMWLIVVSRSSGYWLGMSHCVTHRTLVDVEVCLGIPLCVTRWVPCGSRGLILGSTGRGAPLFVSRQCFPNTLLDVPNSYWMQKLVEIRPSKKMGQMNRGILGTCGNQYFTGTRHCSCAPSIPRGTKLVLKLIW